MTLKKFERQKLSEVLHMRHVKEYLQVNMRSSPGLAPGTHFLSVYRDV